TCTEPEALESLGRNGERRAMGAMPISPATVPQDRAIGVFQSFFRLILDALAPKRWFSSLAQKRWIAD
ncbi:hypothetical protein C8255_13560, partial [filamentous cyanobacterium CCP3]